MTGNRKENIAGNIAGNIARGLTGDKAEEEENVNTRTEKETEFIRESDILFRRNEEEKNQEFQYQQLLLQQKWLSSVT